MKIGGDSIAKKSELLGVNYFNVSFNNYYDFKQYLAKLANVGSINGSSINGGINNGGINNGNNAQSFNSLNAKNPYSINNG